MSTPPKSLSRQVLTALVVTTFTLYWSLSSSGTVSHPGDLDLLSSHANQQDLTPARAGIERGPGERSLSRLPYAKEIGLAARNHGIDVLLLTAIVKTESRFDAKAVSPRGAVGLMQIKPVLPEDDPALLLDPALNLERGATYLRSLLDLFGGDLRLALAAYNAGPNAVRRFGGLPPYAETEAFVSKVLSTYVELLESYEPASESTNAR